MATPRQTTDPEGDKRRALKHAAHTARKAEAAEENKIAAVLFASEMGASLREIAEATGMGHMTVKRIVDRAD